jgi:predicted metal-dependent peptidase
MHTDLETKLAAARTRLILDKPFLGALVLRLPLTEAKANWCPTTATDARAFYFNPQYIDALSIAETQFVLAHEALHCALSHFARRGHRLQHRWDLACDLAINTLLVDDGLTPPPNALLVDDYREMTAEEIYPLLNEQDDERETLDQHVYDKQPSEGGQGQTPPPPSQPQDPGQSGSSSGQATEQDQTDAGSPQTDDSGTGATRDAASQPSPLSPQERESLSIQWQQRLAGAAQQAMLAGKFGGSLARLVDHMLQPQLPWRNLLAHHLSNLARDDFSYMRPSRREGSAILPSLRSGQIDLVVAIDTSGSLKDDEISRFLSEIDALKSQIRARITLLPCDDHLADNAPWLFEPWEEFRLPSQVKGGGGTDFRPVFQWVLKQGIQPELLVYFTDAQGTFPESPPLYPVIWLIKGREKIPWGQRIQLN